MGFQSGGQKMKVSRGLRVEGADQRLPGILVKMWVAKWQGKEGWDNYQTIQILLTPVLKSRIAAKFDVWSKAVITKTPYLGSKALNPLNTRPSDLTNPSNVYFLLVESSIIKASQQYVLLFFNRSQSVIVDIIQQISLIKPRIFLLMTSQASHSHSSLRKKHSQPHQNNHKKAHNFIKQHAFFGQSPENDEGGDSSGYQLAEAASQQRTRWLPQERDKLISLFRDFGADWDLISRQLQTKNQMESRRHFQKIMRKAIQNLNKKMRDQGQNQISFKKIKMSIDATHSNPNFDQTDALMIKEELVKLMILITEDHKAMQGDNLQESIIRANLIIQTLKKNRKKKHSSKASTQIYVRQELESRQIDRGYLSDSSSVFQQPFPHQKQPNCIRNVESCYADEEVLSDNQQRPQNGVVVQDSEQGIKDLLRQSGILQIQEFVSKSMANIPESVASSCSENLNNESYQHFYEQSQLDHDCYWKKSCSQPGID